MAVAGISININSDDFKDLREQLTKFFGPAQATPVLVAAIRKAIRPTVARLRDITPVGPTGNLKRAVASKVIGYKQDGVAVGIVGYTRAGRQAQGSAAGGSVRAGKDLGYHQWWIEYGTDDRTLKQSPKARQYMRRSPTAPFTRNRRGGGSQNVREHTRKRNGKTFRVKGFVRAMDFTVQETVRGAGVSHKVTELKPTYIASSFRKLGPFTFVSQDGGDGMQTSPAYPQAFFKKSNQPIVIRPVAPGGKGGQPPVQTAFRDTQAQMAATLNQELGASIAEAWAALRFRSSGTVSGTDTL